MGGAGVLLAVKAGFGRVGALLAKVPAWVWVALAALLALWLWGNHREAAGFRDGKDSRNVEVAALVRDRDAAIINTATLKRAVADQNAAVAALAAERDAALTAAKAAVEAGRKRAAEVAGTKAKLAALARSKGPCAAPLPDAIREGWDKL